jgi:hypothetical protein
MSESVEHFMERLRDHRGDGDAAYIALLERAVEERLRLNVGLMAGFDAQGDRRPALVCDCGVIAKGFAAARCGRDGRTNIQYGCPTREVDVLLLPRSPEQDR